MSGPNGFGPGPQQRTPRVVSALPASGPPADFIYVTGTDASYIADNAGNYQILDTGGGGSGDVTGPASAVSGHLAVFGDTSGKVIADGGAVPAGIGGSTGATDNAILRANGTGGSTVQSSIVTIDDNGLLSNLGPSGHGAVNSSGLIRVADDQSGALFPGINVFGWFNGNVTFQTLGGAGASNEPSTYTYSSFARRIAVGGTGTAASPVITVDNFAGGSEINLLPGAVIGATGTLGSANDVGLARNGAGVYEINSATAGTFGALLHDRKVSAKTTGYPVVQADHNTFFTNVGAGSGVTFTLPTPVVGMTFEFCRVDNQTVTLDVDTGITIQVGASVTTAGGNVTLDAVGSRMRIVAVSTTKWFGDLSGAATFN